jgi:hypothetical protein
MAEGELQQEQGQINYPGENQAEKWGNTVTVTLESFSLCRSEALTLHPLEYIFNGSTAGY